MSNRLKIAKDLLTHDGFIAIAIHHSELFYLGVLADEIFDRENRVGIVTVVDNPEAETKQKFFAISNQVQMSVYAKDKNIAEFTNVVIDEDKKSQYNLVDTKGRYKLNNYLRLGGGDDNLKLETAIFFILST